MYIHYTSTPQLQGEWGRRRRRTGFQFQPHQPHQDSWVFFERSKSLGGAVRLVLESIYCIEISPSLKPEGTNKLQYPYLIPHFYAF